MNIYQMYEQNNCQFEFYVIKDSWATVIAKVVNIEGVNEGNLINGISPYFGNPKVYAEFYKVIDNEDDDIIYQCHKGNLIDIKELSCPGTYAYKMIEL